MATKSRDGYQIKAGRIFWYVSPHYNRVYRITAKKVLPFDRVQTDLTTNRLYGYRDSRPQFVAVYADELFRSEEAARAELNQYFDTQMDLIKRRHRVIKRRFASEKRRARLRRQRRK